jgi:hypothetical protein
VFAVVNKVFRAEGDDGAPGGGAAKVPGSAPALGRTSTRLAGQGEKICSRRLVDEEVGRVGGSGGGRRGVEGFKEGGRLSEP